METFPAFDNSSANKTNNTYNCCTIKDLRNMKS